MIKAVRYNRRQAARVVVFHAQRQSYESNHDGERWFGKKHSMGVLNLLISSGKFPEKNKEIFCFILTIFPITLSYLSPVPISGKCW